MHMYACARVCMSLFLFFSLSLSVCLSLSLSHFWLFLSLLFTKGNFSSTQGLNYVLRNDYLIKL